MSQPRLLILTSHEYWLRPFRSTLQNHFKVKWLLLRPLQPLDSWKSFLATPFEILIRRIKTIVGIWRAKVIFVEWANDNLALATRWSRKQILVCRLHRYEVFNLPSRTRWNRLKAVVVVNQRMGELLKEEVPELEGRIHVIHNLLDRARWKAETTKDNTYRLGLVGKVEPRKGILEALRAFKAILEFEPKLTLHIVGRQADAEYLKILQGLVRQLAIDDKVFFQGFVEDLESFYQGLDVIMSFSHHESTQLTLFEGLSCGAYPLSFGWDGVTEFLPSDNIFYTESEFVQRINDFYELNQAERQNRITELQNTVLPLFTDPDPREELTQLLVELMKRRATMGPSPGERVAQRV